MLLLKLVYRKFIVSFTDLLETVQQIEMYTEKKNLKVSSLTFQFSLFFSYLILIKNSNQDRQNSCFSFFSIFVDFVLFVDSVLF